MSQLSKRIYTSIILLTIFLISLYNKYILFFLLIFCFYQIFYELFNLLKDIDFNKIKIRFYLSLLILLCLLSYLINFVWMSLITNNYSDKVFLLLIISISVCTDLGGFIFGKLLKGKKLTKISPNKTYAGMYGSFIISLSICFFLFKDYYYSLTLIFIIFFISSVSQLGDIFISYLKRLNNTKDTGNLLPGHGGILDRFDGIVFAILLGSIMKVFI